MWGMGTGNSLEKSTILLYKEAKLDSKENEFRNLASSFDRVNLVFNYINKLKIFKDIIAEPQGRKSNKDSDTQRKNGNDYFLRDKNYLRALESYTKSIASAEDDSSYLALAYANRSACLFEGKYYKECIEDIDRALSLDYPENLKPKLLRRKAAAESQKLKSTPKQVKYYSDPPVIKSKNHLITCAEDSIEIQYNKKYGRHIIATRDIKIGEVLSAENSFCHVVHEESKYIHCHECLELCFNMIPCKNCSSALYCSEECRSKCYEEYHKYECQFPKILLSPEMVFIKLALIGMDDSKKINSDLPDNIHRSDSFKEIIKLEMNEENRNYINLCIPAIAASIAYHAIKENQEFTSKYDTDEDDHNLKKLLYKAYMINAFNPFNIKKIRYTPNNIESTRVGTALYAFTSLYNHSCVPNCEFFHYGSLIVTRAQANIKKGEQVTISYGRSFSRTPKDIRQAILRKNYLFECDCKACTRNWPTIWDLPLGKELPLSFQIKLSENTFDSSESNQKLVNEILTEGKRLYYQLEKYEPCQNLLTVQDIITEIYTYQASKDVEF